MSSPLDSPDVPITCSVATLQSAESLSIRRQVRLAELSSGQFNDLLVANPHFALMHTLLSPPESDDDTPDTPSANVTPSTPTDNSYFLSENPLTPFPKRKVYLKDFPQSPSAALSSSSDSPNGAPKLEDIDYLQFYDEFWEMTKFEYDLQCISSSDFNSESMEKSDALSESKFWNCAKDDSVTTRPFWNDATHQHLCNTFYFSKCISLFAFSSVATPLSRTVLCNALTKQSVNKSMRMRSYYFHITCTKLFIYIKLSKLTAYKSSTFQNKRK